jgi:hypothetical protein
VISYRVDGDIVLIVAVGGYTTDERDAVYEGIRQDDAVVDGALLLIDARGNIAPKPQSELRSAIQQMIDRVGTKIGSTWAVVLREDRHVQGHMFQAIAAEHGLRVGLFFDEGEARQWLRAYQRTAPTSRSDTNGEREPSARVAVPISADANALESRSGRRPESGSILAGPLCRPR